MINHSERMLDRLENTLNDFDANKRREALQEIAELVESGQVEAARTRDEVNLHFHSFFSYNAYGWSPSRIAWESRKYGLAVAGIVDFDVVDGMDEFLQAGEIIDIPTTVALETRVRIPEYSDKVISSPNEPGIGYYMAAGCFQKPTNKSGIKALDNLKETARKRNLQLLERVNDYLDPVRLDYNREVMPLTPSGNATERHLLAAYDAKARIVMDDKVGEFWAMTLEIGVEEADALLNNSAALHEKMRSKLMKYGGVGYVAPTEDTFPEIRTVIQMSKDTSGLPTMTWLDGTNPGEADMPALLGLVESMGTVALNIVPDRNWNVKDAEEKRVKVENLEKAVRAARALDLPLCVGTELNKLGLPFVDDFSAPELQPYIEDFMRGAYFFWGHTVLAGKAGMGFDGEWSNAHFSTRAQKNDFYTKVGRLARPSATLDSSLKEATPEQALKMLG